MMLLERRGDSAMISDAAAIAIAIIAVVAGSIGDGTDYKQSNTTYRRDSSTFRRALWSTIISITILRSAFISSRM